MVDGSRALFTIEGEDPLLGSALVVPAPGAQTISILYKTSPEAEALQWYPAELTQGKRQPFLFTQSQAILARTWVPCQDRPGVRFTYEATVKVAEGGVGANECLKPNTEKRRGHL